MKKSLSIMALVLASFGFAPSAFCAPKACPSSKKKNHDITKAPKKRGGQTKSSETKVIFDLVVSKEYLEGEITQKNLRAPIAAFIHSNAFSNQPNLEIIYLPEAVEVGSRAFENCEKLKTIVFTDKLKLLAPDAFLGCPNDLKIIYEGKKYSASDLMKVIEPLYISVIIRDDSTQPLAFRDYGPDKINIIVQPMREKIDDITFVEDSDTSDTTIAEDPDTSDTIVLSKRDR